MPRTEAQIIGSMTNLGDSGQTTFVQDWAQFGKELLKERGVSQTYINSSGASYILAKIVTDMVEDGELSKTTEAMVATLRINHPVSEDD